MLLTFPGVRLEQQYEAYVPMIYGFKLHKSRVWNEGQSVDHLSVQGQHVQLIDVTTKHLLVFNYRFLQVAEVFFHQQYGFLHGLLRLFLPPDTLLDLRLISLNIRFEFEYLLIFHLNLPTMTLFELLDFIQCLFHNISNLWVFQLQMAQVKLGLCVQFRRDELACLEHRSTLHESRFNPQFSL